MSRREAEPIWMSSNAMKKPTHMTPNANTRWPGACRKLACRSASASRAWSNPLSTWLDRSHSASSAPSPAALPVLNGAPETIRWKSVPPFSGSSTERREKSCLERALKRLSTSMGIVASCELAEPRSRRSADAAQETGQPTRRIPPAPHGYPATLGASCMDDKAVPHGAGHMASKVFDCDWPSPSDNIMATALTLRLLRQHVVAGCGRRATPWGKPPRLPPPGWGFRPRAPAPMGMGLAAARRRMKDDL